jgi:CRISPR-associated protein Cmr1
MRSAPPPPPESVEFQTSALETVTRSYRFLTYVFGGGVKTREHERFFDERTPVRVPSIRGQLRFWWRACNPRECSTVEELYRAEEEVWGSTSRPSQVSLVVLKNLSAPKSVPVFRYDNRGRLEICPDMREIAYGAFPLQPAREAQWVFASPGVLFDYQKQTFVLELRFPASVRNDVRVALWAWENFGGLGSRTRRGFGAIERAPADPGPPPTELSKITADQIEGVPSLAGARFACSSELFDSSLDTWKEGLRRMQRLRQGAGVGRNWPSPGSRSPAGRSRWPEPDAIRRLTGKCAKKHEIPVTQLDAFPRAAFGMPIVFHFHPGSDGDPGSKGDPKGKPLELRPTEGDRFASPVILRPIPEGTKYRLAALVLESPLPAAVLRFNQEAIEVTCKLDQAMASQITVLRDDKGTLHEDPINRLLVEIRK